jgi:hypothetical protein
MKKYLGVKVVSAEPMSRNAAGEAGLIRDYKSEKIKIECDGYKVVYEDGYESWSPYDVFEKAYRQLPVSNSLISYEVRGEYGLNWHFAEGSLSDSGDCDNIRTTDLTFGQAIEALKQGKKVTRKGWNGKGMFLWLNIGGKIAAEKCDNEMIKDLAIKNGGEILELGTVCMYTHDSTGRKAVLTGWLASQSDMLSEDWEIIE